MSLFSYDMWGGAPSEVNLYTSPTDRLNPRPTGRTAGLPALDPNTLAGLIAISEAGGMRGETGVPMASGGLTPAAGAQQPNVTPADRVNARAQSLADARLRNQTAPGTNPWDMFGMGNGDWASAWRNATTPQDNLIEHLIRKQVSGPNVSSGLAGLFNSGSGPYGQMQAAAAYTAPARNDRQARMYEADTARDIAGLKYGTANTIARQFANALGGQGLPMTGVQTDYGASARLNPVDFRRFFVRR